MKTEKEIEERIENLKDRDELDRESATVFENAPLALIQMDLESRITALEWVLEEIRGNDE